ncbi:MAG: CfrBI family restriction endonuclease [Chloroflexota bacterium]|nr:CfrBI family restriction endonuclease [Chloroflexota bacterium]MDE2858589.1 CfrBI family restriction endonuclease [Chloroflexota bacterium]MDE2949523.1 CfrBI family restriction endonuclease [Chloroflexota bacterium]
MPLADEALQNVLRMILKGEHYRKAVINEISDDFLRFTVRFFKEIATAKIEGMGITDDWYKRYFLEGRYPPKESLVYTGLNDKTVLNIYGSASRSVILKVVPEYYDELMQRVSDLISSEFSNIRLTMTIRYNDCSVELSFRETLIIVNTLAAKHAEIRGGAWSGLGKRLELPLMLTLAKLYHVPPSHYAGKGLTGENREVDFHFLSRSGDQFFCEVKLMGKGNPESADSTIARRSNIFIAQTLSDKNKSQLTNRGHHWVELGAVDGYRRIHTVFSYLDIPCAEFTGDLDSALDDIIPEVFQEIT